MRTRSTFALAAIAALTLGLITTPGSATHTLPGKACGGGATTLTENPDVRVDSVDDGQIDKWRVDLAAGEKAAITAQWLNGDADLYVCKLGQSGSSHVCASPNMYPIGDGCLYEEALDINDPVFDIRVMDWGRRLEGPGTFFIHIQHCFSSKDTPDGGTQGDCDYATVAEPVLTGGELDPLPPVQYILALYKDAALP